MGCVQVRHLIVLTNAIITFGCTTKCLPRVAWWPNLLGACSRGKPRASVPRTLYLLCETASTVPTGIVCSERKFYMTSHTRRTFCFLRFLPFLHQCWSLSMGGGSSFKSQRKSFPGWAPKVCMRACPVLSWAATETNGGRPVQGRPMRGRPTRVRPTLHRETHPGETHQDEAYLGGTPHSRGRSTIQGETHHGRTPRGDLGPGGAKSHCPASDQLQGHLRSSGRLALLPWDSNSHWSRGFGTWDWPWGGTWGADMGTALLLLLLKIRKPFSLLPPHVL